MTLNKSSLLFGRSPHWPARVLFTGHGNAQKKHILLVESIPTTISMRKKRVPLFVVRDDKCVGGASRIINAKKKSRIHLKKKTKEEMDSIHDYTFPCQGKKCHPKQKRKSAKQVPFCDNITKLNIMCITVN